VIKPRGKRENHNGLSLGGRTEKLHAFGKETTIEKLHQQQQEMRKGIGENIFVMELWELKKDCRKTERLGSRRSQKSKYDKRSRTISKKNLPRGRTRRGKL